ncbi:uncharacterized protein LOC135132181 [Zophobas morio]|uniref:uncharacterized protein LOC135132181 n=1 Tax=Zophobas morio TaxID=2755281 RepID=UPI0030833278
MGDVVKQFITQFHNLPGETIKEKQQTFYKLLQQHGTLKNESKVLATIAAKLVPNNHLEKILRTDFLIYFKVFDSLYKDFMNGDEITINKLSKQDWFFQRAFKEVNYEEFTNSILPTISYSLKLKILKKLPVEEEVADQFFDAVCKRYGTFVATVLLPKCSSLKIKDTIKRYPVKLSVAQLKSIFNKDPDLICVYVEERTKIEGTSAFINNNPILTYIAQKNPKLFTDLYDEYSFSTTLGRRTTKGVVSSQKDTVVHNKEDYLKILNNGVMVRKIGSEIKDILFENYPSSNQLYWNSLIRHYPKHQQFDIFETTYNSLHCHKFAEDINAVSEDMLKMMPNAQEREKLALLKMELECEKNYLKYVTSNYCLKELMNKINHLTTSERAKYIELATDCCCLNKDMTLLEKLCELVCVRCKNDDASIRRDFLNKLSSYKCILEMLDEKHWKYIIEIMVTEKAKNRWIHGENDIMLNAIKYLVKNDKSLKELIQKYKSKWDGIFMFSGIMNDFKSVKLLLSELLQTEVVKPSSDEPFEAAAFDCYLACYCKIYNKKYPNDTISIYDNSRIIKSAKKILEDGSDKYLETYQVEGIQYIVCQQNSSEEIQQLKKLYFKSFESFGRIRGLIWFLKHEPKTLQENFDHYLNIFFKTRGLNPSRLWRLVKKCTHLDLDRRTVEFCRQKLAEEKFEEKKNLIRPLTILSSPTSHLEFIKSYVPTVDKVDLTDDDITDLYNLQGKVVRVLHYLNSPTEVVNATFDFCKGDYLQFALSPLYSCIYKLPENETKQFINKLDEVKALSVRKHAMNLSCVIYDVDDVYNCLKNATVPSLTPTIKYFSKHPSEALWKVIETQIGALEKNELPMLKLALDKINVPFEYKSKYIEIVWNVLDKYENNELKKLLFQKINEASVEKLDPELAFNIIRKSIFKGNEANDVVATILLYLKSDKKFTVLSDILSNFKKNCWNHPKMCKPSRQQFNKFMLNLFDKYMGAEKSNAKFVTELKIVLGSVFTLSDAFVELIAVECMTLKDENLENQSKLLIKLNNIYTKEYGTFAVNLFAIVLNNNVRKHIFTTIAEQYELCHSLLQLKESISDYLLVIKLLPHDVPEKQKYFELYDTVVSELNQVTDKVVQLQFNLYLKAGPYKNVKLDWDIPRSDIS